MINQLSSRSSIQQNVSTHFPTLSVNSNFSSTQQFNFFYAYTLIDVNVLHHHLDLPHNVYAMIICSPPVATSSALFSLLIPSNMRSMWCAAAGWSVGTRCPLFSIQRKCSPPPACM